MRSRLIIAGLVAVLGLGGCGVPDSGPAIGYGPARGSAPGKTSGEGTRSGEIDPTEPANAVKGFMEAALGMPEANAGLVKQYIAEQPSQSWKPVTEDVTIVSGTYKEERREDAIPAADGTRSQVAIVSFTGRIVGVLHNGYLDRTGAGDYTYEFTVHGEFQRSNRGNRWLVTNPPDRLMLQQSVLEDSYPEVLVYFQLKDAERLVPDARRIPPNIVLPDRHKLLANWLIAGPRPGLGEVAQTAFPANTLLRSVPVESPAGGGALTVDLSVNADVPDRVEGMVAQLLHTFGRPRIDLQIGGGKKPLGEGKQPTWETFAGWNPVVGLSRAKPAYITDGKVAIFKPEQQTGPGGNQPSPGNVPKVLAEGNVQGKVLWAGSLYDYGVLVVADENGKARLKVANGTLSGVPSYTTLDQEFGPQVTSQPEMFRRGSQSVALAGAGSALLLVTTVPPKAELVTVEGGGDLPGTGSITSVAVAPDGVRVVYVRGNRLYTAILAGNRLVGPAEVLSGNGKQAITQQVYAASWNSESGVVVSAGNSLFQVPFTGLGVKPLASQLYTAAVDIASYVPDPVAPSGTIAATHPTAPEPVVEVADKVWLKPPATSGTPGGRPGSKPFLVS
ncbi:LpqB family beta-propeller domain-containing protein [Longispora albida]|uniref:LpqB family beta-propeller domain-containing protein n=1 Tax=Longispora albida TaxID=203523 RepID=UPI0003688695|nr:LpqB family beta-propeller domain-containing protein [Longispora albida]